MIRTDQIPDEVVEAAARMAFTYYKSLPWDECTDKHLWRSLARAAIAAALSAWPSGSVCQYMMGDTDGYEMVLPLPQEAADE
jgi:hypothetical protein